MTSGEHSPGFPSCLLLWRQTLGLMRLFFPLRWYQNFPQCSLGRSPFLKFRPHNWTSTLYSCIPYIMPCFSLFRIVEGRLSELYYNFFLRLWQWKFTLILCSFLAHQAIFLHQFSLNCNHYCAIVFQYYALGPLGFYDFHHNYLMITFTENLFLEDFIHAVLHVVQWIKGRQFKTLLSDF